MFYWVRDNVLYRVGLWNVTAAETLAIREGTCTNKSNLLVALLRARGIPAGYGVMKVYGQKYFGPVAIPMLNRLVSKVSTHVYVAVYLDDKWIKCDPSDDKKLCSKTSHFNYTTTIVDWDGVNNAELNLNQDHIISDDFPIASIDNIMIKKHGPGGCCCNGVWTFDWYKDNTVFANEVIVNTPIFARLTTVALAGPPFF